MENIFICISTVISAIATGFIAYYAYLTKKSQDKSEEQLTDLYAAIVIATLLSANTDPSQLDNFIGKFKTKYNGKTKIFK